jgi:hypothetical protein
MKDEKCNSEFERKNQDKTSEISDSFSAVWVQAFDQYGVLGWDTHSGGRMRIGLMFTGPSMCPNMTGDLPQGFFYQRDI